MKISAKMMEDIVKELIEDQEFYIAELLSYHDDTDCDEDDDYHPDIRTRSFKEAGVLTSDRGVVVRIDDNEFYLTIQRK